MAHHSNLIQEIRRFNQETSTFIDEALQTLQRLETLVDNTLNAIGQLQRTSTISSGSASNGRQERDVSEMIGRRERGALKRSSDEPDNNESPIKKPRTGNERVDNEISNEAPKIVDEEMNESRSIMNIKANMGKYGTLEYLDQWLARVYDQTAKFYTIQKYNHMGTFLCYVAIDVNLDEAKDDIHVVINSDHLCRPDIIFRFIENCFHERKVVTLLHIVTNDEHQLREDPERLQKIIKAMIEPIVVHLQDQIEIMNIREFALTAIIRPVRRFSAGAPNLTFETAVGGSIYCRLGPVPVVERKLKEQWLKVCRFI